MDIRRQRRKEAINTSYLIDKFKGKYRLLVEYNRDTNDFNRKLNDTYEDCDIYISCQHGNKVFYYGNSILDTYHRCSVETIFSKQSNKLIPTSSYILKKVIQK